MFYIGDLNYTDKSIYGITELVYGNLQLNVLFIVSGVSVYIQLFEWLLLSLQNKIFMFINKLKKRRFHLKTIYKMGHREPFMTKIEVQKHYIHLDNNIRNAKPVIDTSCPATKKHGALNKGRSNMLRNLRNTQIDNDN